MKTITVLLIFVAACSSQDVKVIHLEARHAENALVAWRRLKNAQAAWEGTKEGIRSVYFGKNDTRELVFSDDFTVILPSTPSLGTTTGTTALWSPCITTSPVSGTTSKVWPN